MERSLEELKLMLGSALLNRGVFVHVDPRNLGGGPVNLSPKKIRFDNERMELTEYWHPRGFLRSILPVLLQMKE